MRYTESHMTSRKSPIVLQSSSKTKSIDQSASDEEKPKINSISKASIFLQDEKKKMFDILENLQKRVENSTSLIVCSDKNPQMSEKYYSIESKINLCDGTTPRSDAQSTSITCFQYPSQTSNNDQINDAELLQRVANVEHVPQITRSCKFHDEKEKRAANLISKDFRLSFSSASTDTGGLTLSGISSSTSSCLPKNLQTSQKHAQTLVQDTCSHLLPHQSSNISDDSVLSEQKLNGERSVRMKDEGKIFSDLNTSSFSSSESSFQNFDRHSEECCFQKAFTVTVDRTDSSVDSAIDSSTEQHPHNDFSTICSKMTPERFSYISNVINIARSASICGNNLERGETEERRKISISDIPISPKIIYEQAVEKSDLNVFNFKENKREEICLETKESFLFEREDHESENECLQAESISTIFNQSSEIFKLDDIQHSNDFEKQSIQTSKNVVRNLQDENNDLKLQIHEILCEVDCLNREMLNNTREIEEKNSEIDRLISSRLFLLQQMEKMQIELENVKEEKKRVCVEMKQMESVLNELKVVHSESSQIREMLQSDLKKFSDKFQSSQDEITQKNHHVISLQEKVDELEGHIKKLSSELNIACEKNTDLQEKLLKTHEDKGKFENMFERLQLQLESVLEKFEMAISQRDEIQNKNILLQQELLITKQDRLKQEELEQKEKNDYPQLFSQIENLQKEISFFKSERQALQLENSVFRSKNDALMSLNNKLETEHLELRQEVFSLRLTLDELRDTQISSQQFSRGKGKEPANKCQSPRISQSGAFDNPKSVESHKKVNENGFLEQLEEIQKKHMQEISLVQSSLTSLTGELEGVTQDLDQAKNEISILSSKLIEANSQIEVLEDELQRRQRRLDLAVKERKQNAQSLQNLQILHDELTLKFEASAKKLAETQNSKVLARFANTEVVKLTSIVKDLQKKLDQVELDRDHLHALYKNGFENSHYQQINNQKSPRATLSLSVLSASRSQAALSPSSCRSTNRPSTRLAGCPQQPLHSSALSPPLSRTNSLMTPSRFNMQVPSYIAEKSHEETPQHSLKKNEADISEKGSLNRVFDVCIQGSSSQGNEKCQRRYSPVSNRLTSSLSVQPLRKYMTASTVEISNSRLTTASCENQVSSNEPKHFRSQLVLIDADSNSTSSSIDLSAPPSCPSSVARLAASQSTSNFHGHSSNDPLLKAFQRKRSRSSSGFKGDVGRYR
eukprot:GDKJ01058925.1.p1 GENE.GDKJ01058925.1~~GDKJ01058925.1.p1  ORF type:complete len:1222 (-),score=299.11 GDKJ01058925.1:115-3726(-)